MPRRPRLRRYSPQTEVLVLMERDGPLCYLCGEGLRPGDPLESDHVVPFSYGGSDDLTNKRLAHRSCNQWKGTG